MPFSEFSWGPYDATWGGSSLGLVQRAWSAESEASVTPITADRYGDSVIDGIYRGANAFLIVQLKEWTAAVRDAIWPFATWGETGDHGRALSDLAKTLVLTALPGSPAATKGPVTLTASKAIYAPGHRIAVPMGNEERIVGLVFQCLPTSISPTDSTLRHWLTT